MRHPKNVSRFIHIEVGLGPLLVAQLRASKPFLRSFVPLTRQGKVTAGLVVAALILGGPVGWFVAVDWSWFIDECPDCGYYAHVRQYRVLTMPISEDVSEHPTIIQRVAADLGHPCWHPRLSRWHKHRWWGLCHCAAPCWNGLYSLSDDDAHAWYDTVAYRVCAMGDDDPELGREWYDRVIIHHDRNCARTFFCELDSDEESESAIRGSK